MPKSQSLPEIQARINAIADDLARFRRDLHAHPELAYEEHQTAAMVLQRLGTVPGLRIRTGVAGTGIVATLQGTRPGPCLALRAEMDALPIQERTGLPHASVHQGRMHACGHDGHMACLVGAAAVLSGLADELSGCVKFIFQPAEETGAGALRMIEAGALDDPKTDAVFALHAWPQDDLGAIAVGRGPVMAGTRTFDIHVCGRGTHAAYPHLGSDVIAAAAQIVIALQTIRSRRMDPVEPAVLSICRIAGGETYNVLPDTCRLQGTIRALRPASLDAAFEQVRTTAQSVASTFGAEAKTELREAYPPLLNDPRCAALVEETGRLVLGERHVDANPAPSLGAEDFAYYAQRVPAAFYRLGIRPRGAESCMALHNPCFDFTDAAIPTGVAMHGALVLRFLANPPPLPCG